MKRFFVILTVILAVMMVFSCENAETIENVTAEENNSSKITTKALGDKSPALVVYVETNDVNPCHG